jgi:hypothetical protein
MTNKSDEAENIDYYEYLLDTIKEEEHIIKQLNKQDKIYIKKFIYDNFIEKGYEKNILTDKFLNYEMYNCIRYSKLDVSPHMNELYLPQYSVKIKDIIIDVKYGHQLRFLRLNIIFYLLYLDLPILINIYFKTNKSLTHFFKCAKV